MARETEQTIKDFIVEVFLFGQGGDELDPAESLLEKGVIDSTGVLELMTFIEERFGIKVDDSELVPENFDSIGRVAAFVERKLGRG